MNSGPEVGGAATVRGERGTSITDRARSLQSRVGGILSLTVLILVALLLLSWYYHTAYTRARPYLSAASRAQSPAQTEMALPPLGAVAEPPGPALQKTVLLEAAPQPQAPGAMPAPAAPEKTPAQLALERRLSGAAFSANSTSTATTPPTVPVAADSAGSAPSGPTEGDLAAALRASPTPMVRARLLPTQQLLLAKGTFIDCTLETAIDSTLPGLATCVTATDTFGADGRVVLLERGTKLIGETRGQVQQGAARVFVLWTEARTPTGVVVPLDSPAADELGRAGLPGEVNRHFWQRFGAALLISTIDGAVQAAVQASARSGGTVVYAPSAAPDVLTEVLKSTVNIAPTLVKHQGDRIQALVARDVDFRGVYELRLASTRR
jgi:type IV secretion system protein VirB10